MINGIVLTGGKPKPGVPQVAKTGQPVGFDVDEETTDDDGPVRVRVTNRHAFSDLSGYDIRWRLLADDAAVDEGSLDVDPPPGESETGVVPVNVSDPRRGREYRLDVSVTHRDGTAWAEAGHEIAWGQFDLAVETPDVSRRPNGRTADGAAKTVATSTDGLSVETAGVTAALDVETGTLDELTLDGRSLLASGPRFEPWRAPTQSETNLWGPTIAEEWRRYSLDRLVREVSAVDIDESGPGLAGATVRTRHAAPGETTAFTCDTRYEVLAGGDVLVGYRVVPGDTLPEWLPKIGLEFALPGVFDRFSWYGRGPVETYPDRKTGARTGRHEGDIDEQYTPYVRPQTYGNKTDVRWAALTDGDGTGLVITTQELTNVTARRHMTADLDRANYRHQLTRTETVRASVDTAVTGVGSAPVITLPEYRVEPREYEAVVAFRPCRPDTDPAALGRWSPTPDLADSVLTALSDRG